MVCESARQSQTVLNWAVQDQSPDSLNCRGFSPRWKGSTRVWCCFDWRERSMVLFFALSVFKVLHIWPFTAWTPCAARQRKWLLKWSRLLCMLALHVFASCTLRRKLSWSAYLLSADVELNVLTLRVTLGRWGLVNTSLLMNYLIHFYCGLSFGTPQGFFFYRYKYAHYFVLQPGTSRGTTSALLKVRIIK